MATMRQEALGMRIPLVVMASLLLEPSERGGPVWIW